MRKSENCVSVSKFEQSFYVHVWRSGKSLKMSRFQVIPNWLRKLNIFIRFDGIWKMNNILNVHILLNISKLNRVSHWKPEWVMSQAFTTNKPNQIKKYADNDETMMKI